MRVPIYRLVAISTVLIFILGAAAIAQVITGDVLGTVSDQTGAVIANAKVSIVNQATNASRNVETGSNGEYVINLLPPGHYSLAVEAQGFKSYKVGDLSLSAGDRSRLDITLQLGNTTESVEVTTAAPLLQTDSSSVGSLVAEQIVEDLPLNGRNLTTLVTQQPGVNSGLAGSIVAGARPDDRRQTSEVSANGQREYYNSNLLDGIDNNERFYGLGGVKPSIESIQEVHVETNNFPAEVGRSAGAVVTVITKSGSNAFHGSLYEYFRNDALNAWDYFKSSKKSEWRQNQFGGSISGPVIKDKTFFYFDVEQYRLVQGITSPQQVVPSQADDALVAGLETPDPVGALVFSLYPAPNVPGNDFAAGCDNATISCLFVANPARTQNSTTLDARVDHHITGSDTIFARYSYNPVTSYYPPFFPAVDVGGTKVQPAGAGFIANGNFPGTNKTTAQGAQINYTHIFSSHFLMDLRMGFTRINIDSEPIGKGTNAGNALGIPNANVAGDPNATGMPGFHFLNGYADLGDQIAYPIHNVNNTYQINGDVIYTHGAHNIKIGAALLRRQLNYLQEFAPEGWLWFMSPMQMAGANFGFPPPGMIFPFVNRQNQWSPFHYRSWEPSVYVQDDWRIRPWLTLNLGVRYDVFTPFTDSDGKISNFDLNTLKLNIGGTGGIATDYKDFAPRLGFAAQLGHGLVLRGGFGMSYYPGDTSGAITLYNPPYNNSVTLGFPAAGFIDNGPPSSPATVDPNIIYSPDAGGLGLIAKQTNWRAAYLYQYNLTMQKQIGNNSITLGYVGSLGRRQVASGEPDMNFPIADSNGVLQLDGSGNATHYYAQNCPDTTTCPLPGIGKIGSDFNEYTSNYNAMQLSFDHKFSRGLTANANYTWAHGLANWSGYESEGTLPGLWRGNPRYDYGNSDLDIRHRIAVTVTYDLPFGNSYNGAKAAAIKGWSVSGSGFWQTGQHILVNTSNKPGGAFGDFPVGLKVNVVPGESYYAANKSIHQYFNVNAFTPPVWDADTFTFGNERSNQIEGPHQRQVDLSLYKSFKLTEAVKMQFRAECYNISNTPNFAQPVHDMSSISFGQIQYVNFGTFPRVWQFALKFKF
ncbi:MAG TPA: TonB-dependent receptor [Terriglobales bacterium]|nr:TonB-dependent receptor [Terriglobales bacterium]